MSFDNTTKDEPVKPDFPPLYYLRIARGHHARHTLPEDVVGYVAWDRKASRMTRGTFRSRVKALLGCL